MKVQLLIKNANVYNSYMKKFIRKDVVILDERFFYIGNADQYGFCAEKIINADNKYMIPGLIDIHVHIESSMTTPYAFSHELIKNGVTTVVTEPHEIANVFGVEGIKAMIEIGEECELDIFYGIPSSVPSTSEEYETTGACIDIEEIEVLAREDNVICLGEVMNYFDVINSPDAKINKILRYFRNNHSNMPIEGHCPRLMGLELAKVIYKGIDSDHTHQTVEGLRERIISGMFVEIQEKSMSKQVIDYLVQNELYEHFCLVTDDVMADILVEEGHLNKLVKKAIQMGMPPEKAVYVATYTPARRMGLQERGSIAPGKLADFVLLDDIENFKVDSVYKNGKMVYHKEENYTFPEKRGLFPDHFYKSIKVPQVTAGKFKIKAPIKNGSVKCRVMEVKDGSTFTEEKIYEVGVKEGFLDWENSLHCVVAVFERYNNTGNYGIGLITGDIIKKGAVAATYAHDHHNLTVVAKNIKDAVVAANTIIESQGGYCAVLDGEILSHVELPVAGILSEESLASIGKKLSSLRKAMYNLGYRHYNSIMSLSTISLPVSPLLKITDKGLINLNENRIVDLFVEE